MALDRRGQSQKIKVFNFPDDADIRKEGKHMKLSSRGDGVMRVPIFENKHQILSSRNLAGTTRHKDGPPQIRQNNLMSPTGHHVNTARGLLSGADRRQDIVRNSYAGMFPSLVHVASGQGTNSTQSTNFLANQLNQPSGRVNFERIDGFN